MIEVAKTASYRYEELNGFLAFAALTVSRSDYIRCSTLRTVDCRWIGEHDFAA
jgi:hypothetical protein